MGDETMNFVYFVFGSRVSYYEVGALLYIANLLNDKAYLLALAIFTLAAVGSVMARIVLAGDKILFRPRGWK
jgi:hypothetical protein